MPRDTPPHPPDETPDELIAALRRNHPEMTDAQLRALLTGEPARRRKGWQAKSHWTAGVKGPQGGGGLIGREYTRAGRRIRRKHRG